MTENHLMLDHSRKRTRMRVAIVGAGLFGCHIALELAARGACVTLFEKQQDILLGASLKNQQRLHKGFHYPRAKQTTREVLHNVYQFEACYRDAIGTDTKNYFGIAKTGSLTTSEQYLNHCRDFGLEYVREWPACVHQETLDVSLRSTEHLLNVKKLTSVIKSRLQQSDVTVYLKTAISDVNTLSEYDAIILTAYARNNDFNCHKDVYQFEVCEKPVVQLPPEYRNISYVVMDGNFMCLDPFVGTSWHLFGNVCVGIHAMNVGYTPIIPPALKEYVAFGGMVENPNITNFSQFLNTGDVFFRNLGAARHIGSFFQVKAVLPNMDRTDDRPTVIRRVDDKVIKVFSGKLSHCIQAAKEISTMLHLA